MAAVMAPEAFCVMVLAEPPVVVMAAVPAVAQTPNLDTEAMATAQQVNPAQAGATGVSYLGALLKNMLDGTFSEQTAPTAPSFTVASPGSAVVTSPMGTP